MVRVRIIIFELGLGLRLGFRKVENVERIRFWFDAITQFFEDVKEMLAKHYKPTL